MDGAVQLGWPTAAEAAQPARCVAIPDSFASTQQYVQTWSNALLEELNLRCLLFDGLRKCCLLMPLAGAEWRDSVVQGNELAVLTMTGFTAGILPACSGVAPFVVPTHSLESSWPPLAELLRWLRATTAPLNVQVSSSRGRRVPGLEGVSQAAGLEQLVAAAAGAAQAEVRVDRVGLACSFQYAMCVWVAGLALLHRLVRMQVNICISIMNQTPSNPPGH